MMICRRHLKVKKAQHRVITNRERPVVHSTITLTQLGHMACPMSSRVVCQSGARESGVSLSRSEFSTLRTISSWTRHAILPIRVKPSHRSIQKASFAFPKWQHVWTICTRWIDSVSGTHLSRSFCPYWYVWKIVIFVLINVSISTADRLTVWSQNVCKTSWRMMSKFNK